MAFGGKGRGRVEQVEGRIRSSWEVDIVAEAATNVSLMGH